MTQKKKVKVVILIGGPSAEHEVSLNTGKNILSNLDKDKYQAESVVISKKGDWPIAPEQLKKDHDIAFIAMHGPYGEDGGVQADLEEVGLPYTGSGVLESALTMNKFLSLKLLQDAGLKIPSSMLFSKIEWSDDSALVIRKVLLFLEGPWVIKPNHLGSSIDLSIVDHPSKLEAALAKIFDNYRHVLIQTYIKGREMTCSVLDHGWPESAHALLPTEIIFKKSNFFDYQAKYEPGASLEITPPRLPESFIQLIRQMAVIAHQVLGCRGMSRSDFILDQNRDFYILETNTIPGMTQTSLLPQAAQGLGMSFSKLLDRVIQASLQN